MVQDMTTGSSAKKLLMFTIPLIVGNIFQQFYNMVDSIIVGQYVGTEAFAAVGSTGSITFLVLGLVFGACSGFAIPVAQDFGAGDEAGVRRCVANIIYISVTFSLILTLATSLLTRRILVWMNTQPEMLDYAYDYLFWIFAGLGALMMYNMLAGILRSLGDSRTPLYFLILSSLLNIVLDILLVKSFAVGVKGASIATVVSQLISGVLCLGVIARRFPIIHLTRADMKPHWPTIRRLLGIGVPMGLQFSITAIGSIILQSSVNGLGVAVVAAVSAAAKIQSMVFAPMDSFGVAMATFTGQNYGAGKLDRVRRGVAQVFAMLMVFSAAGFLVNWLAADKMALLFIDAGEVEILAMVKRFLTVCGMFYPVLSLIYVLRNTLQGVGFSKIAMLSGVFELVARAIMGLWIVPKFGFTAVCFAHPFAWIMADAILIPLYLTMQKKLGRQKMISN